MEQMVKDDNQQIKNQSNKNLARIEKISPDLNCYDDDPKKDSCLRKNQLSRFKHDYCLRS